MRKWHDVPSPGPTDLRDKLLVAWIAYQSSKSELQGGKAHCQVSILFLQMLLCYSTAGGAERALNRLRASNPTHGAPWIEISQHARGVKGHYYRVGEPAKAQLDAWVQLGEALFEEGGFLEPFRSRPLFSHHGIGPYGCMVLAFVNSFGPVTEEEVAHALQTFFNKSSIKKRLGYIVHEKLVYLKNGRYHTKPTLRTDIERHEELTGASEKQRIAENFRDRKWVSFQTEVLGKPEIRMLKAALRKLDCFYCGKVPPPTGADVEHFPPESWGGSDETSLLLPICRKCNGRHGNLLGKHKKSVIPLTSAPIKMVWDGDLESAAVHVLRLAIAQSMHYAIAMNQGRVDDAYESAKSIAVLWAAARGVKSSLEIVSSSTGEIKDAIGINEYDLLLEELNSYRGIPELLKEE